jgi:hypothetical protein
LGLTQDPLDQDDAKDVTRGWQGVGPLHKMHGWHPFGQTKWLAHKHFSLSGTGALTTRLRNTEVEIRPTAPHSVPV